MSGAVADASSWAPWLLLVMAVAATYVWRFLGAAFGAYIDPEGELFKWVACVAYAIVAGLVARILIMPVGILEKTETVDRLGATAGGFVLFFLFRRNIAVGTLSAAGFMMALVWARSEGIL